MKPTVSVVVVVLAVVVAASAFVVDDIDFDADDVDLEQLAERQQTETVRSFEDQQWKRAKIDDNDVESVDKQEQKAAIAVLEAESQKIFSELYDEQVVKAEKYEYPTAKVGGSLSKENNLASVVITLTNGNRYEVVQEQGLSDTVGKQTTIIMAAALPDDWILVETKDIQFSRVVDYIRASDSSLSNKAAVNKMMSLD